MCGIPLPPADSCKPRVSNLTRGFPTYANMQHMLYHVLGHTEFTRQVEFFTQMKA